MKELKDQWVRRVEAVLKDLARQGETPRETEAPRKTEAPWESEGLVVEVPPKPELGDMAFPMFPYAKIFRTSPARIGQEVQKKLEELYPNLQCRAAGPYLNLFLPRQDTAARVLDAIEEKGAAYGNSARLQGRRVMVEFSCPNTNKPLHLGHLRNDALGEASSRILQACGAEVHKVNLINNRGIHICKSMLAYQKFGRGETPRTTGEKEDHFVGRYYVRYNQWAREEPAAEEQARDLLRRWEQGDPEVKKLWETMNGWTLQGIEKTYQRTGVSFDRIYLESETYLRGKDEILKGLERGVFVQEEDGSVQADLSEINLDRKVLLRRDGTSLYLTQDIGTAIARQDDWPFDQLIYVVGSEQEYHFKVLFHILRKLGFSWAENLYHLSYGMVNLPEGKMKSREGTVVDADDLLDKLGDLAAGEIRQKGREGEVADLEETAAKIALGALHYYLLQTSPGKDMIFDPAESLSFNGNTGPYLQYMGARLVSMLEKFEFRKEEFQAGEWDPSLLDTEEEWELIKTLARLEEAVVQAAEQKNPSLLTAYLYELGRNFSRFYHDHPVLDGENPSRTVSRIRLSRAALQVLKNVFSLVNIPFLDAM